MMRSMKPSAPTAIAGPYRVVPAVLAALALEPGNERACYGLGLSLTYAGDRDGAVAQYLRLKELDPALARDLYGRIFP